MRRAWSLDVPEVEKRRGVCNSLVAARVAAELPLPRQDKACATIPVTSKLRSRRMRHATLALLLLVASTSRAASFGKGQQPLDLDGTAARAMQEFHVSGMAVAIVKDGKVVVAKGFGQRRIGLPAAVDGNTLFGIASNTKAFTTAALAMLVDEGKLDWDDPVVKHLPAFAMWDPRVTREMTIRDLVAHRSGLGLGEGDLLWWPHTDYSREEIVRRVRFLKPAASFRSRYAYDNVLFLVAGQVVAAVSGMSWDDFVRDRILVPLGMTSTRTSITRVPAGANMAMPHVVVDGHLLPTTYLPIDNVAPCGAIVSSANEMAVWMIAQLDRGAYRDADGKGHRLFSERQSREMWSPQAVVSSKDQSQSKSAYGLGWGLRDYRGHLMVSHTGGLLGMTSRVLLLPDARLGVTVLENQDDRGASEALASSIVDSYLGAPPTDWIKAFKLADDAQESAAVQRNKPRDHEKQSLPRIAYAGRYRDSWYGDATVTMDGGRLLLRFTHTPALTGDLEPFDGDTFIVRWRDRALHADALLTFTLDGGKVTHMRLEPVSSLTDFSFDFHDLDFVPITP
jgi:CubicO group peptidase (beta-lactamase class C family)